MAKKKPQTTKTKTKPQTSKSKAKPKKRMTKSKAKPKPMKKVPAKPITGYTENLEAAADEKAISDNLKHLNTVANDLGISCEIQHESGGYIISVDEASEDRSFVTAAKAEEFLHEQEQE